MLRRERNGEPVPGWLWNVFTVIVFGVLLAVDIFVTRRKNVTAFELGLLQFIFFAVGIVFSYFFGRRSTAKEAADAIRRDGRKAVRRLANLADSIANFVGVLNAAHSYTSELADKHDGMVPQREVEYALNSMKAHIDGQIRTVSDAIEDWRDIVPEEVKSLEQRALNVESRDE